MDINNSINEQNSKPNEDLTGRDRLTSNVIFSWGGHFVFIIGGFIMPRMIDHRLGQELLGVWDFAWALVTYFALVQLGINSSVTRYVAKYRAAGDAFGMNRVVSSAAGVLCIGGLLILALTITFVLLLPRWFGTKLGENVQEAQWVVLFLGTTMAVEVSFSVFGGIITGCHRWAIENIIKSGWRAATVTGMIVVLLYGGGLFSLAIITLSGVVLDYGTRAIIAFRICKDLRLKLSLVRWKNVRQLFAFGGKSLIPSVSNLLLNQTTSVLIISFPGPAALALYTRPRFLILHMNTLVNKMANVLVPTVSSLQCTDNIQEIRVLLIKSVRYSFYVVLPMVLVLTIFGGPVLKFWMGSRYDNDLIPAILAVGSLLVIGQAPLLTILVGMNAHGWAGIGHLVASICSAGLAMLTLGYFKLGLTGTAVAVTLPLTIMNLVYLPYLMRRCIGLSIKQYYLSAIVRPAVHVIPFAVCLLAARIVFREVPLAGLLWGGILGCAILAVLYWRYVLPNRIKRRLQSWVGIGEAVI
jgi:O-antigen/teichoic acid export membrane protein